MIVLGVLLAIASALAVRALSVVFTRPLTELTAASEAVAAGDYSRTVGDHRGDDWGASGAPRALTLKLGKDMSARERAPRVARERGALAVHAQRRPGSASGRLNVESRIIGWSEHHGPEFGVAAHELPSTADALREILIDDRAEIGRVPGTRSIRPREHEVYFRPLRPDGAQKWVLSRLRIVTEGTDPAGGRLLRRDGRKELEVAAGQGRRRWTRSASSPAASRTTSTTC